MALSKNFIIYLFGIVFTLLLFISSNATLASRHLSDSALTSRHLLLLEEDPDNNATQTQEGSGGFNDPPSEGTPCKSCLINN
ncbi:hypothetical protein P8452_18662 [Trifolium repens]|nr:hypothetical protein QL285_059321 [Trifolium repens]WJX30088.1 hypothetical protein P8452_18662 [Trifolium repens]